MLGKFIIKGGRRVSRISIYAMIYSFPKQSMSHRYVTKRELASYTPLMNAVRANDMKRA